MFPTKLNARLLKLDAAHISTVDKGLRLGCQLALRSSRFALTRQAFIALLADRCMCSVTLCANPSDSQIHHIMGGEVNFTRKRAASLARLGSSEPKCRKVLTMHRKGKTLEVSLACLTRPNYVQGTPRESNEGLTSSARSSAAYGYSLVWLYTKP